MRIPTLRFLLILVCIAALVSTVACPTQQAAGGKDSAPKLPTGIPELIKILGEKHHANRNAAIQALSARGQEAVDPLLAALADENEDTREGATQALAGMGAVAVPTLNQSLLSQTYSVRYGAISALGEIGSAATDSITPLMRVFGNTQSMNERTAIVHAVVKIAPTDPQVLSLLQACLIVKDLRQAAMTGLGEIGPGAEVVVPKLLPFLEDKDPQTRFETIVCLEGIGPVEGVVQGIAGRLKDTETRVRLKAAQTLGKFGLSGAGAASVLAAALDDPEADVRQASARALGEMAPGSISTLTKLTNALQDKDPQTRREVAVALGKFGSPASSAVKALQKVAQSDEFDYVRTAASQAIEAIQGAQ